MSDKLKLGELITDEQYRDAIHVAVFPVTAGQRLAPATHVGFLDGGTERVGFSEDCVGIIDPFLELAVKKGERCWLFLYPNTVTGMRHEWRHPAFDVPRYAGEKPDRSSESEAWLRAFATKNDVDSYEELLEAASDYLKHGSYLSQGGRWEGNWVPDEFWMHYETVTGTKIEEKDRGSFFSCSC